MLGVPADAPGVSVVGDWDPLGMRGTVSRNLLFKDVFVPEDAAAFVNEKADGEHVGREMANGYDRGSGRHRSDVAMAGLLAEALLAYQHGQRSGLAETSGMIPAEPTPVPTAPTV